MDEDTVRQNINDALAARGESLRWLSLQIGRSHAYIEQYMQRKKPKKLHYDDKLKVSRLLGLPMAKLGVTIPPDAAPAPSATAQNILVDAELYAPAKDRPYGTLASMPHYALYRVKTPALERHHRLKIEVGDLIHVRLAVDGPLKLERDEAYLVNLYDKANPLTVTTIIRQHIPPHLLISNSDSIQSILSIEQAGLPFEIIVEGKIETVIRNSKNF